MPSLWWPIDSRNYISNLFLQVQNSSRLKWLCFLQVHSDVSHTDLTVNYCQEQWTSCGEPSSEDTVWAGLQLQPPISLSQGWLEPYGFLVLSLGLPPSPYTSGRLSEPVQTCDNQALEFPPLLWACPVVCLHRCVWSLEPCDKGHSPASRERCSLILDPLLLGPESCRAWSPANDQLSQFRNLGSLKE